MEGVIDKLEDFGRASIDQIKSFTDALAYYLKGLKTEFSVRQQVNGHVTDIENKMSVWRANLVIQAEEEYKFWACDKQNPKNGRVKEDKALMDPFDEDKICGDRIITSDTEPPNSDLKKLERNNRFFERMVKYVRITKRSEYYALSWNYVKSNEAWSAAFNSYMMYEAGIRKSDGFNLNRSHSIYIIEALLNRLNRDYSKLFWLYSIDDVEVKVGDIIVKDRAQSDPNDNKDFDTVFFKEIQRSKTTIKFKNGQWEWGGKYFTCHSDIVTNIEKEGGKFYAYTIGGNTMDFAKDEVNSVGRKKYLLSNHKVEKEVDKSNSDRATKYNTSWAIIKMMDNKLEDWTALEDSMLRLKQLLDQVLQADALNTGKKIEELYKDFMLSQVKDSTDPDLQDTLTEVNELIGEYRKNSFMEVFGKSDGSGLRDDVNDVFTSNVKDKIFPEGYSSVDKAIEYKPTYVE